MLRLLTSKDGYIEMSRARRGNYSFRNSSSPVLQRCRKMRDMGIFSHHNYTHFVSNNLNKCNKSSGSSQDICDSMEQNEHDVNHNPKDGIIAPLTASISVHDNDKFAELLCGTCMTVHQAALQTFHLVGCFSNTNNFVLRWANGVTWEQCASEASRRGELWFAMSNPEKFPQGSGLANCGMKGDYLKSKTVEINQCENTNGNTNPLGRLLGSSSSLAVYRVKPSYHYIGCYANTKQTVMSHWLKGVLLKKCVDEASRRRQLWFVMTDGDDYPKSSGLANCGMNGDYSMRKDMSNSKYVDQSLCISSLTYSAADHYKIGVRGVFAVYQVKPVQRRSK